MKYLTQELLSLSDTNVQIHRAINRTGCTSREISDFMTLAMNELSEEHDLQCIHIPHWHHLGVDEDARIIRNIMRSDVNGLPVSQSRKIDLLNYMSMCLQHGDKEFAAYVQELCYRKIMCSGEKD
ncbi:MAG: hypothetical protein ABJH28_05185 [Paraglaciecola sp.]|uniref:hypothetical protein n=1 Tax=Paraglaciecola sp. TaxID=1920173 RepID=UPI003263AD31